jgi:hypothetical protein
MSVDLLDRVEGGFLQRPVLTREEDVLRLPAIELETALSDVYRDAFPAAP